MEKKTDMIFNIGKCPYEIHNVECTEHIYMGILEICKMRSLGRLWRWNIMCSFHCTLIIYLYVITHWDLPFGYFYELNVWNLWVCCFKNSLCVSVRGWHPIHKNNIGVHKACACLILLVLETFRASDVQCPNLWQKYTRQTKNKQKNIKSKFLHSPLASKKLI